jgi:hypothetical protein
MAFRLNQVAQDFKGFESVLLITCFEQQRENFFEEHMFNNTARRL